MPAAKFYSLLIGARNDRGRFHPGDETRLRSITARHFPTGFTILEAQGGWFDPTKAVFRKEQARQILICTSAPRKLAPWCRELGKALRQEEVLVINVGPVRRFRIAPANRSAT